MGRVSRTVDVGALLDQGSWTAQQKRWTILAALAIIFDGFDIQILGFAIPSLIREWLWEVQSPDTLATASAGAPRSSAA